MRSACPPIMYSCKYLNFSSRQRRTWISSPVASVRISLKATRVTSTIWTSTPTPAPSAASACCKTICEKMGFDSLSYQSLQGMIEAIGIDPEKICTYCWDGRE